MDTTADAVVIGAGIAGASTALFLRRSGLRNVCPHHRSFPGAGASGHGSGLIRAHGADRADIQLAHAGVQMYRTGNA